MNRFGITLGRVNRLLLVVLVIAFAAVLFLPVNPLEIKSAKVEGTTFKAGSEMSFTIDRCKNVDKAVSGTASRYFEHVDDPSKADIFISSTDDLGEKGCGKVTRTIDIPAHVKDGRYRLKFVTRYFPSILREPINIEYTSKDVFTIQGQELSAKLDNVASQLQEIQQELGVAPQVATTPSSSDSLSTVRPKTQESAPNTQVQTLPVQPQAQPNPPQQATPQGQARTPIQDLIETVDNITNRLLSGI